MGRSLTNPRAKTPVDYLFEARQKTKSARSAKSRTTTPLDGIHLLLESH